MAERYETRAVAGAAYVHFKDEPKTHTYDRETDAALCKRPKPKNLLDDTKATDPQGAPTCSLCLRRDPRFNGRMEVSK